MTEKFIKLEDLPSLIRAVDFITFIDEARTSKKYMWHEIQIFNGKEWVQIKVIEQEII